MLDSYEAERLPVIRDVLFGTEKLTDGMASTNPVRRALIDHVGPWIGSREIVQEHAAARMSQVAIAYRQSPLSERSGAQGALQAGDRLPDLDLQQAGSDGWHEARAQDLLDPSDFTVLFTSQDGPSPSPPPFARTFAVQPPSARQKDFRRLFGASDQALLVRPDGYVALICPAEKAASRLEAYSAKHLGGVGVNSPRLPEGASEAL